jgi:hypothetical protein
MHDHRPSHSFNRQPGMAVRVCGGCLGTITGFLAGVFLGIGILECVQGLAFAIPFEVLFWVPGMVGATVGSAAGYWLGKWADRATSRIIMAAGFVFLIIGGVFTGGPVYELLFGESSWPTLRVRGYAIAAVGFGTAAACAGAAMLYFIDRSERRSRRPLDD